MAWRQAGRNQPRDRTAREVEQDGKRGLAIRAARAGRLDARRVGRSHLSHFGRRRRPGAVGRQHRGQATVAAGAGQRKPHGARRRRQSGVAVAIDRRQARVGHDGNRRPGLLHGRRQARLEVQSARALRQVRYSVRHDLDARPGWRSALSATAAQRRRDGPGAGQSHGRTDLETNSLKRRSGRMRAFLCLAGAVSRQPVGTAAHARLRLHRGPSTDRRG